MATGKVLKRLSKAGTQRKGLDASCIWMTFREHSEMIPMQRKYIYCSYCPDGKGRVDCCEVLWPCGQTGRLRGLAAGFDIGGGNRDNQEGTQRRHHENESTAAGHSQAFGDTAVSVRGWVV
ncbi:hypothetical protein B0H14DRAFT_2634046 [Mycena olivaceomarginata]|nr:hypothetical protein B0H14DRAFT_2634046 [Mycena olivaceomarginata]